MQTMIRRLFVLEFAKILILSQCYRRYLNGNVIVFQTWESITEDGDGLLEVSVSDLIQRAKRQRMHERAKRKVKLGMMRHLYVVLDMSECMGMQVK